MHISGNVIDYDKNYVRFSGNMKIIDVFSFGSSWQIRYYG